MSTSPTSDLLSLKRGCGEDTLIKDRTHVDNKFKASTNVGDSYFPSQPTHAYSRTAARSSTGPQWGSAPQVCWLRRRSEVRKQGQFDDTAFDDISATKLDMSKPNPVYIQVLQLCLLHGPKIRTCPVVKNNYLCSSETLSLGLKVPKKKTEDSSLQTLAARLL